MLRKSALAVLVAGVMFSLPAWSATISFDFEDGLNQGSSTEIFGLSNYMTSTYGSAVNAGDARWFGSSNTFGSDAIFTNGYSSELNFDPLPAGSIDLKIVAVSFDYGVLELTGPVDFGLDVYDDATQTWYNNVFTVDTTPNTGVFSSGVINMDASWEITRLRFHDHGTFDVGMDNLTIVDNRGDRAGSGSNPTPEPSAVLLFGVGAFLVSRSLRSRRA
jgi:hypothetical protein